MSKKATKKTKKPSDPFVLKITMLLSEYKV